MEHTAASEAGDAIRVRVHAMDGRVHLVQLPGVQSSVAEVKRRLAEISPEYADPSAQRLIFRGRVLQDSDSLSQYGIQNDNAIHLVTRASQAAQSNASPSDPSGTQPTPPMHPTPTTTATVLVGTISPNTAPAPTSQTQSSFESLRNLLHSALASAGAPSDAAARGAAAGAAAAFTSSAFPQRRAHARTELLSQARRAMEELAALTTGPVVVPPGDPTVDSDDPAERRVALRGEAEALTRTFSDAVARVLSTAPAMDFGQPSGIQDLNNRLDAIAAAALALKQFVRAMEVYPDGDAGVAGDAATGDARSAPDSDQATNGDDVSEQEMDLGNIAQTFVQMIVPAVRVAMNQGVQGANGDNTDGNQNPGMAGIPDSIRNMISQIGQTGGVAVAAGSGNIPPEVQQLLAAMTGGGADGQPAPPPHAAAAPAPPDGAQAPRVDDAGQESPDGGGFGSALNILMRAVNESVAAVQTNRETATQGPSPEAGRPSLLDVVTRATAEIERAGQDVAEESGEENEFDELLQVVLAQITLTDGLEIYQGNWDSTRRLRQPVREFFVSRMSMADSSTAPSESDIEALCAALFESRLRTLTQAVDSDPQVQAVVRRTTPPSSVEQAIAPVLMRRTRELVSFWMGEGVSDEEFPERLRLWADTTMGESSAAVASIMQGGWPDTEVVVQRLIAQSEGTALGQEASDILAMSGSYIFGLLTDCYNRWQQRQLAERISTSRDPAAMEMSSQETAERAPPGQDENDDDEMDYDELAEELAAEDEAERLALEIAEESSREESDAAHEREQAGTISSTRVPQASRISSVFLSPGAAPAAGDVFDRFLTPRQAQQWRRTANEDVRKQEGLISRPPPLSRGYRRGNGDNPVPPAPLDETSAANVMLESVRRWTTERGVAPDVIANILEAMVAVPRPDGRPGSVASAYLTELERGLTSRVARDPDFDESRFPNIAQRFRRAS